MRVILSAVLVASLGFVSTGWAQPVVDDDQDDEDSAAAPWYGAPEAAATEEAAPVQPAQEWRYNGPHAINAEYGSGWCNIAEPHTHPYPPFDEYLFEEEDGGYYFVGDPVDFGYIGVYFWFDGGHPVASGWGHGWCHMSGPHRHIYRPFGGHFSTCGPYHCYRGPFDALYWRHHATRLAYFTSRYPAHYRGGVYYRTRVPAWPGRFAGYRPGHRPGASAGRPAGYARPVPPRPLPPLTRPTTLRGRLDLARGQALPRILPGRVGAPPRPWVAPAPVPRAVMPRVPLTPVPRPHVAAPAARASQPSAPAHVSRPSAPAHASRPSAPSRASHTSSAPRASSGDGRRR
jgi:hypothetical protein